MDRSSTVNEAMVGMVLKTSNGYILKHALNLIFRASNNETKYDALSNYKTLPDSIHCDSMLIVKQVKGDRSQSNYKTLPD